MTMADLLLQIANDLRPLLGLSANLRRARRHDTAALFAGVAECLAHISDKLERDEEPVKECSELSYYAQALPKSIRRIVGFWDKGGFRNLGAELESSVEAPSRATFNLQRKSSLVYHVTRGRSELPADPAAEIAKIRQASGLFLAASNLVKGGAKL